MLKQIFPHAPERFLAFIKIQPTGCWEWQGTRIASGYGQFWWQGRMRSVSRMSLLFSGKFLSKKASLIIRHACDNPPCCNPAHLIAGTQAENIKDAHQKNRAVKGETHGMHILTEADVLYIRKGIDNAAITAKQYGVSKACIHDIRQGLSWKHLLIPISLARRHSATSEAN